MATKQIGVDEVERGVQYLRGCLDLVRSHRSDLRRDFDYAERKVQGAKPALMRRGVYNALVDALSESRRLISAGQVEAAEAALDAAATALRSLDAPPHNVPRVDRGPH